ncbi:hypothetical protein EIP86_001133 [Pleurotus ostreatoroseus]|nr:hypothetical protein EIP86_001133 [Pleurotus ostreatoroseus]
MGACDGIIAESRDPGHVPFPIAQGANPSDLMLAEEGMAACPGASLSGRISEEKPEVSSEDVDQPDVGPGSALDLYLEQRKSELIVQRDVGFSFAAFETEHRIEHPPISGWHSYIHPKGWIYYYKQPSADRTARYATQAHLHEPSILAETNRVVEILDMMLRARPHPSIGGTAIEVVIDRLGEGSFKYYMVNHTSNCLFHPEKTDHSTLAHPSMVVQSKQHLQVAIDVQYWKHVELFPQGKTLHEAFWQELKGLLIHGAIALSDTTGDPDSMYPYKSDRMKDLLDIVETMESSWSERRTNATDYVISAAASLMSVFLAKRAIHRYAQPNPKLARDQREIFESQDEHAAIHHYWADTSRIEYFLSVIMFFAPRVYFKVFRNTNDNLLTHEEWVPVFDGLKDDWQQVAINAAVLMNANIAFLAIPGIPIRDDGILIPIQVICQLSILLSLMSMITGLVLIKQNAVTEGKVHSGFFRFVTAWRDEDIGLYAAAFMFSIPYVLLIWSTVSFLASLGLLAFEHHGTWQRTSLAVTWSITIIIGLWGIFARKSFAAYRDFIFFNPVKRILGGRQ